MVASIRGWIRRSGSGSYALEIDYNVTPKTYMTSTGGNTIVLNWSGSFENWVDDEVDVVGSRNFDIFNVTHADRAP